MLSLYRLCIGISTNKMCSASMVRLMIIMKISETILNWKTIVAGNEKTVPIVILHPEKLRTVTCLISIGIGGSRTTARKILNRLNRDDFAIALWPFQAFPPDKKSLHHLSEEAPQAVIKWLNQQGSVVTKAIGHSQGANVIIAHAAKYPDSLQQIALISPTLTPEYWSKTHAAVHIISGLIINGFIFWRSRDYEDKRSAHEVKDYMIRELCTKTHGVHNRLSESFMNALDGGLTRAAKVIAARDKPSLLVFCGKTDFVASARLISKSLNLPQENIRLLEGGHASLLSQKGQSQLKKVIAYL